MKEFSRELKKQILYSVGIRKTEITKKLRTSGELYVLYGKQKKV